MKKIIRLILPINRLIPIGSMPNKIETENVPNYADSEVLQQPLRREDHDEHPFDDLVPLKDQSDLCV